MKVIMLFTKQDFRREAQLLLRSLFGSLLRFLGQSPIVVHRKVLEPAIRFYGPIISAALVLLFLVGSARATAVFVFIYPNEVVLSADSKISYTGDPPANIPRSRCKIVAVRSAFFAVVAPITSDSAIGLDLYATIEEVLNRSTGTLVTRANAVEAAVFLELNREYSVLKTEDPERYTFMILKSPLKIAFAAWENNHPALFIDRWRLLPMGNMQHDRIFPGTSSDPNNMQGIGEFTGVDEYKRDHPNWQQLAPVDLARDVIQAVIDSRNPTVGPPISVLRINAKGAQWIGQGGCPDIPIPSRQNQQK